jgi:hypothetical protein
MLIQQNGSKCEIKYCYLFKSPGCKRVITNDFNEVYFLSFILDVTIYTTSLRMVGQSMNSEMKKGLDGRRRGVTEALSWRVPEGTKETKKELRQYSLYHGQYSTEALPELTKYWVQCPNLNA